MTNKVKPIPEGFHTLTPHIIVKGLPKALEFYKKALGAVEHSSCEGPDGKVCHAELKIGDSMLMMCEECANESLSLEAVKMRHIQINTGNQ